jgi:hypothetical protein
MVAKPASTALPARHAYPAERGGWQALAQAVLRHATFNGSAWLLNGGAGLLLGPAIGGC